VEAVDRVFNLRNYGNSQPSSYIVITPEHTATEAVRAAWSYAVRYTAKGLDLPDYEKAAELLAKRHPSWTVLQSRLVDVPVELAKADSDVPEAGRSDTQS
jgi:hypothetical protein